MSQELVVAGEKSNYLALRMDQTELVEMIQETVGAEGLSPSDLDRVKVPTGGGTAWEIPNIEGDTDVSKTIQGVILDVAPRRAYWNTKFDGSNDPPDCYSNDGEFGIGDPGGDCASCPFNQYGTAVSDSGEPGEGKACGERRLLFVLPEDSIIPIVLSVPPSSINDVKKYRVRLLRGQKRINSVVTSITLEKDKNKTGIEFSRVKFTSVADLDPQAAARMREYASAISGAVAATNIDRED